MKLRSAISAMLWENWQVSRIEAAQRVALGIVAGSAALAFLDSGQNVAFWILIAIHSMIWFSIAKLNGGRFMDGYKPGFPFYLLFTRPVPTIVFVGVAMAYDAITCTALYLASAALLGVAFGKSLPLFSVALSLIAYHMAYACCQWSTRNRIVQWVGSIGFSWPMFWMVYNKAKSPLHIEFSLVENAVFILIAVVSFVLTVVGVARQRRGDSVAFEPQPKAGTGAFPNWLVNLFRFSCPTSSAARAQLWFELRSSGLPILVIGLCVSAGLSLLYAVAIVLESFRHVAVGITIFAIPVVVFSLGSNAFGIRRKQGRTYASAFELSQPYGTARLAALKIFVRTTCVLVTLTMMGASVWAASSFMSNWGQWLADGTHDALPKFLELRGKIGGFFGSRSGFAIAAIVVVAAVALTELIAWQASREALRARYPRLLRSAGSVLIGWSFVIVLLAVAHKNGIVPQSVAFALFKATYWASGVALVLGTIYLLWSGLAERALTIPYVFGACVITAAFGAAWLVGVQPGNVGGVLWLMLAILVVIVLAPWSLNRVRHA